MENKNGSCSSCCSKVTAILSVLALVIASAAYFCPKKGGEPSSASSTFDEKIKGIVLDVIKENPQLVMDAMGEGMAKKRDEAMNKLSDSVADKSADISNASLKFGRLDSKTSIIAFIDPLDTHCVDFLRSMVKISASKKDVCFKLMPVAVLGEDSITLAKVIIAAYEKGAEKALAFIEKVTAEGSEMDKAAIEKALKAAGLNSKEIEGMMEDTDKKLAENGKIAENLRLPLVPAIFMVKGKDIKMLQAVEVEPLVAAIEGK